MKHQAALIYRYFIPILLITLLILFSLPSFLWSDISGADQAGSFDDSSGEEKTALYDDFIDLEAANAILFDVASGNILWEKKSREPAYPASLTKIMTGIVAIEDISDLEETAVISANASGTNHSAFGFKEGDRISLKDLLKAALICSHNNATIALAEHISGSTEEFIRLMNRKAEELGASDTWFENTNGLDSEYPGHRTTAYDLALISGYAMKNQLFKDMVNTNSDRITINEEEVSLKNTNKLLFYDYVKGIKTGYTLNAGFCLAVFSDLNGRELITIVLNSTADKRETDVLKLIYWADNNIDMVRLVDSEVPLQSTEIGTSTTVPVDLFASEHIDRMIHITNNHIEINHETYGSESLPVSAGQKLGTVEVLVNGETIATSDLVTRVSIDKPRVTQDISDRKRKETIILLGIMLLFYFLIIIFIIFKNLSIKKMPY